MFSVKAHRAIQSGMAVHTPVQRRAQSRTITSRSRSVSMSAASGDEIIPDDGFSLAKVSFGDILSPVGTFLMIFGFGAYFQLIPGSDVSGVALIYGFPMLLLGFALKYGDEQHLEEALERIFLIGRPKGLPRRQCPRLTGLREEVVDGNYALVLEFLNRNGMTPEQWQEREQKFGSFFGPGITASIKILNEESTEVVLRTDGSGEGMEGDTGKDVLPPLAPGQKPRVQG